MKVLVSGSFRDIEPQQKVALQDAARELGRSLAAAGHTVIVGTADPEDVDPYVVEGVSSAGNGAQVEVHLMKGSGRCYTGQANVTNSWHRYDDWDVTVLEVVRYHAEGVVVMAGRKGVIQAGIAGWMLGRPTIPFAGFGGGARTVWEYGSSDRQRFYFGALTDIEIDQLDSPWQPGSTGESVVKHLDRCAEFARRASVSPRLRLGVSLGMLMALVVWVAFLAVPLLRWPPDSAGNGPAEGIRFLFLLGAVCSAGVFGALVQSMRGMRAGAAVSGQSVSIDAVLGIAAGFLTAALYMLAEIAINATYKPPLMKDYARVALIVSMAAVFASLYLDAAFSRFDVVKESVMSGTYGRKQEAP